MAKLPGLLHFQGHLKELMESVLILCVFDFLGDDDDDADDVDHVHLGHVCSSCDEHAEKHHFDDLKTQRSHQGQFDSIPPKKDF